jgi:hypothetical protein
MPSTLETNQYHAARRFLETGQREWVLVIARELLRSASGRELGHSLLAEMYPTAPKLRTALGRSAVCALGGDSVLAAEEQEE